MRAPRLRRLPTFFSPERRSPYLLVVDLSFRSDRRHRRPYPGHMAPLCRLGMLRVRRLLEALTRRLSGSSSLQKTLLGICGYGMWSVGRQILTENDIEWLQQSAMHAFLTWYLNTLYHLSTVPSSVNSIIYSHLHILDHERYSTVTLFPCHILLATNFSPGMFAMTGYLSVVNEVSELFSLSSHPLTQNRV